jgi:hypothetical protein
MTRRPTVYAIRDCTTGRQAKTAHTVPQISQQFSPPSPRGIVSAMKRQIFPSPTAFWRGLSKAPRMETFPFDCETGAESSISVPLAVQDRRKRRHRSPSLKKPRRHPLQHAPNPHRLAQAPAHQLARWLSSFAKGFISLRRRTPYIMPNYKSATKPRTQSRRR